MPHGVFAGAPANRNVLRYDCCPEEYIDITFSVQIRRRKLYYVFNLVVPCLMLNLLSLIVFTMPPDAGEKVTCGRSYLALHIPACRLGLCDLLTFDPLDSSDLVTL